MSSSPSSQLTLSPPQSPSPPPTAEELKSYPFFFRQRKPPVSAPPVPCLRCAIVDMHCVIYRGDTRCQRCERNGEELCISQVQDVTLPEVKPTKNQLGQLAEEEEEAAQGRGPRHEWLMAQKVHQKQQAKEGEEVDMQCMLYTRDRELAVDRGRLLELAQEMFDVAGGGRTWVHGLPVPVSVAVRNFALPKPEPKEGWRESLESVAGPGNSKGPAYFWGLTAEQAAAAERVRRGWREKRAAREAAADLKRLEREGKAKAGGAAGNDAASDDATGDDAAGDDAAGKDAAGKDAAGKDAAGKDAAGDDAASDGAEQQEEQYQDEY
ncbi:hypothetical protein KVR01_004567 [Diaporthe batatas]|uniref:uncharacterized protein n=1 Tax=Diaporthe batatas TaxID=748121 RepID=UPI001D0555AF|nr:uncharacterized protein KVR01_004567 [Diaporthe batatas]KAG8166015.1 hypothetical protein KVR01_004567 [Diaporthe batatas]